MLEKKPDDEFCGVQNYSVLIPYKDLELIVKAARKTEEMTRLYRTLEKRYGAMQQMHREMLEKIEEINKYL